MIAPMEPKARLKAAEAATYLGLTEKTLANWRSQNVGPAYLKVAGRVQYVVKDLDSWIEQFRIETARASAGPVLSALPRTA